MRRHVVRELAAFAEDQVAAANRLAIERHLADCPDCRTELQRIRHGIALASQLSAEPMPSDVAVRIRLQLRTGEIRSASPVRSMQRVYRGWQTAAAAMLAMAVVVFYWQINRPWVRLHAASETPGAFERDGRELHTAVVAGTSPLAFVSSDERAIWQWLESQGAPVTSMRVDRSSEERTRVVPIGAAVHTLDGAKSSVLAYRIDGRPVTLTLALARDVPDAPAAGWWTKRVMHRRDANGANTLTWTAGGGTYVMVSELDGTGVRACLICHTTPAFRQRIESLIP